MVCPTCTSSGAYCQLGGEYHDLGMECSSNIHSYCTESTDSIDRISADLVGGSTVYSTLCVSLARVPSHAHQDDTIEPTCRLRSHNTVTVILLTRHCSASRLRRLPVRERFPLAASPRPCL